MFLVGLALLILEDTCGPFRARDDGEDGWERHMKDIGDIINDYRGAGGGKEVQLEETEVADDTVEDLQVFRLSLMRKQRKGV